MTQAFQPKIVLGIVAHPDDLDFGAAGSLAKWAAAGTTVYIHVLTDGGKGSADPLANPQAVAATRQAEQQAAAAVMGATEVVFSQFEDGQLQVEPAVTQEICRSIRRFKPDTIITWDPTDVYSVETGIINHPDHRAAGQAALDAAYPLARDPLSFPKLIDDGLEPHKVSTVLLINQSQSNYYSDITGWLDTKLKALGSHSSQVTEPLRQFVTTQAKTAGKQAGCEVAEGFMRINIREF